MASLRDAVDAVAPPLPVTSAPHLLSNASSRLDAPLRAATAAGVGGDLYAGRLRATPALPPFMTRGARSAIVPPLGTSQRGLIAGDVGQEPGREGPLAAVRTDAHSVGGVKAALLRPIDPAAAGRHVQLTPSHAPGLSPEFSVAGTRSASIFDGHNGQSARRDRKLLAVMRNAAPLHPSSRPRHTMSHAQDMLAAAEAARDARWSLHDDVPRGEIQFTKGGAFVSARGGPGIIVRRSLAEAALSDGVGPLLAAEAERRGMLAEGPPVPYRDSAGVPRLYLCSYIGAEMLLAWREYALQEMNTTSLLSAAGRVNERILHAFDVFLRKLQGAAARRDGDGRLQRWYFENALWAHLPVRDTVSERETPLPNAAEGPAPGWDGEHPSWQAHLTRPDLVQQLGAETGLPIGQGMTPAMAARM